MTPSLGGSLGSDVRLDIRTHTRARVYIKTQHVLLPTEHGFYVVFTSPFEHRALVNIILLLCKTFHSIRKEFDLFAMIQK